MRYLTALLVCAGVFVSGLALGSAASAQTQNTAQEKAASLRSQLIDVETKQAELQTRLQKLDENLKPGNIEHNLAGVGSTKPEDLREQRRRQLEIERNGVQRQLDLLATSHTRLETAIAQTDAEAYRQSAAPVTTPATPAVTTAPSTTTSEPDGVTVVPVRPRRQRRVRRKKAKRLTQHQQAPSPVSASSS